MPIRLPEPLPACAPELLTPFPSPEPPEPPEPAPQPIAIAIVPRPRPQPVSHPPAPPKPAHCAKCHAAPANLAYRRYPDGSVYVCAICGHSDQPLIDGATILPYESHATGRRINANAFR